MLGDAVLGAQARMARMRVAVPFMGHPFEQFDLELQLRFHVPCS